MSSEIVSHWPQSQHNSHVACTSVLDSYCGWQHIQISAQTSGFLSDIYTSASLVSYQSISPPSINTTLITLLNIDYYLSLSWHQTIIITYNISVTSKSCP